jgi:hypothetical protein
MLSCRIWTLALWKVVVCALVVASSSVCAQQYDPRQVLSEFVREVQTGTPNAGLIGMALWQTIALQTGGTGFYPELAALGPVTNVVVNQQLPMEQGMVYALIATHQQGASAWNLGISYITGKIEYATFTINAQPTPLPPPLPPVHDPGGTQRTELPGQGSPACQKFPDLCN